MAKPSASKFLVPYSAGIAGEVRVIYVPTADSIVVNGLEVAKRYIARRFDPVSGETAEIGVAIADEMGNWNVAPPQNWDHDWVLILQK
jgi:hypothetical protein